MEARRSRAGKKEAKPQKGEVKIFIQLLVCVALICGFMIFKDSPLPNGKTPAEYVSHFLNTTVNMEEIVKKLSPDGDAEDSVAVSGSAEE